MKLILVTLSLVVAMVHCRPQKADEPVAIVAQASSQEPDGSYQWSYESANGIKADETGTLKKAASADQQDAITSSGSFSYTAPDGTVITVTYTADDVNGFVPSGSHLPTPPPTPEAIQKLVEYLNSLPSTTETPKGRR